MTIGINTFDETKDNACDKTRSVVFVENPVVIPPEATTILQNTGMNAYTKSDATDIAIDAIETVVVSFTRITVEMRIAVAVE